MPLRLFFSIRGDFRRWNLLYFLGKILIDIKYMNCISIGGNVETYFYLINNKG